MIIGILLGLFMVAQPFTVSTAHLMCNQGKCPKVNCFIGWQYKGYDMNGRLFTTCRFHTFIGQTVNDANLNYKKRLEEYFMKYEDKP